MTPVFAVERRRGGTPSPALERKPPAMSQIRTPFVLGLTGLLLIGCDARSGAEERRADVSPSPSPSASKSDAKADSSARPTTSRHEAAGAEPGAFAPAPPSAAMARGEARADEGEAADASPSHHAERHGGQVPSPTAGLLTAGRWSDRDDWSRWQQLLAQGSSYQSMLDAWSLGHLERVAVTLRAGEGVATDVTLVLEDDRGVPTWRARTDNRGRAELYLPPGHTGRLVARAADGRTLATRQVRAGEQHELRLSEPVTVAAALDLMFVVDTTGSMGDEIHYLQSELADIVGRVQRDAAQALQIRTSVNFYKDHGDAYVVQSHPFSTSIDETLGHLRTAEASGGGDFPEALDLALADAVEQHPWSESAVARIVFVVTDAPAHDGLAIGRRLQDTAALAASKGIRIVPVASSGIDKPTEFLLRHLAVSTGGTYVFLTDHSGIGGDHIEATVGPHTVEPLNDLLVEVIEEYTTTDELGVALAAPVAQGDHEPRPPQAFAGTQPGRGPGGPGPDGSGGLGYLGVGLMLPMLVGGLWWHRSRRAPAPIADARVARARRMLGALTHARNAAAQSQAPSWATEMREVVEGMEQLARQQQAIDASLRVAALQPGETDPTGTRTALRAEVARRRAAIDAEIEAGLVSVEAAYLHVIGGVGERGTTQASLDAAREALQIRVELERELRA